jgi:flagellar assembly protein FliH
MGLIKSPNTPASLSPFSMKDIESQATAMLARAGQQADQLLASAKVEGKKIRQDAYDEGFRAGQEDGLKRGTEDGRAAGQKAALAEHRAQLEQLSKTLSAAISEMDAKRSQLESNAAAEVIRLAVAIARRVTKLQGSLDPAVMTENVKSAMKLVVHSADVRIAVNPAQKQALEQVLPQLRMSWPSVTHVHLIEDASIALGGCQVLTAHGEIDAELDGQVDRVAADLLPGASAP